jgi:hypothetical protein
MRGNTGGRKQRSTKKLSKHSTDREEESVNENGFVDE